MTKNWKVALIALACACGPVEPVDDDAAEDILIGKSDAFGYTEGSADANRILTVANTLTLDDLRGNVGLTKRAAEGIVAARPFATLAALDSVPYVGKTTFTKLLAAAAISPINPTCAVRVPDDYSDFAARGGS